MRSIKPLLETSGLRARTARLDLYRIDQSVRTRTTIVPQQIETFPAADHRSTWEQHELDAFYAAVERSRPHYAQQPVEYRLKAVALDAGGARIAELYASAILPFGMYEADTYLRFGSDAFVRWIEAAFG